MDACNLFIQAANGLSTGVFPEVFLDVLFPKAFGFEDLTNINYDSMEKNSDSLLGEVTHIAKSKKLDFKKSLIKSVGEYLKSRGFIYSTEPQTYKSNNDFIRVINDKTYVLRFANHPKENVGILFQAPATFDQFDYFSFTDEKDLQKKLLNCLERELDQRLNKL